MNKYKYHDRQKYTQKRGYDLYLNGKLSEHNWYVPSDAVYIFTIDEFHQIESFEICFYFHQTKDYIEFWIDSGYQRGVIARLDPPDCETKNYIKKFMVEYFVYKHLFSTPVGIIKTGYLSKSDFRYINKEYKRKTKPRNINKIDDPHGILKAAKKLQLYPSHVGGETDNCIANCPGTNHFIMVSPSSGQWGCGWCKRKGGSVELKQFVADRQVKF